MEVGAVGGPDDPTPSLNFAAFLRFVQTEAPSILCSSLLVLALIGFIELVLLRADVRLSFFFWLQDLKSKSYAQAQALVPWLLRAMSMRVRSLLLALPSRAEWRAWWTWERTFIFVQASIGLVTLLLCTHPLLAQMKDGNPHVEAAAKSAAASAISSSTQETPAATSASAAGVPCDEDSKPLAPAYAKLFAGVAVFVGGALMNCKAFMRIPVL